MFKKQNRIEQVIFSVCLNESDNDTCIIQSSYKKEKNHDTNIFYWTEERLLL